MRAMKLLVPSAVVALVLAPMGASAATTSSTDLPGDLSFIGEGCAGASSSAASFTHMVGPSGALGAGSLRFNLPANDSGEIYATPGGTASTLSAMSFKFYLPKGAPAGLTGLVSTTDGTKVNVAYEDAATTGAWGAIDLLNDQTIHWTLDETGPSPIDGSGSWTQFVADHGSESVIVTAALASTCGHARGFANIDNADYGTGNTYDFEAAPASATSISAPASKLVYGQAVTLHTRVSSGASGLASKHVRLLAKKAGTMSFNEITDVTTGATGTASKSVTPKVNTTYKWVFDGDPTHAPSTSGAKVIGVARKLTITLADATLTRTEKLKAHGLETPAKAGSSVNVWRHNASGTFKIGSAIVKATGAWALAHDFPKGKWSVYATAPADATHIASRSRAIAVASA